MEFADFFPIWDKLTQTQQNTLSTSVLARSVKKGTIIHNGELECTGVLLVRSGQLRAYVLSPEGREVSLYRLFEMDLCMLSAACVLRSIQFGVTIEAEKDSDLWIIPPMVYKKLLEESAPLANYNAELMATRFSEIMWLMEQIMWKSLDKRLAAFLLDEAALEGNNSLKITHEIIGNHLGSAREVVTRMLRYFQSEGMVKLSRGTVEITDPQKLRTLHDG
jgi:CRP/FNR family transcriptional regulator